VVKLRFEGGLVAAWKPDTRRGPGRYRGEVAARRLATALGLEANVPEAMLRGFALDELRPGLPPEAVRLLEAEAVPARDGRIPGALIPWIPGLRFPPLDRQPALGRWRGELAGAPGAQELQPVGTGQHDVEHHQVGLETLHGLLHRVAAIQLANLVAVAAQILRHHLAHGRLIVDHEHTGSGHAPTIWNARPR